MSSTEVTSAQVNAFTELSSELLSSVKESLGLVNKLQQAAEDGELEHPDGLSLLTVKVDALLSYIHHCVLLGIHRLSGRSLGSDPGASFVQTLVKLRLYLEKMRPMEARLKYQMEKLLQAVATEEREVARGTAQVGETGAEEEDDDDIDPLAFRPNPEGLASAGTRTAAKGAAEEEDGADVYRPPKMAPVMYDPDARLSRRAKNKDRQPSRNAALLADLSAGMSANPYETSVGGVGGGMALGSSGSSRARALRRMETFEEDNYKRLSLSKKDAKRRRRDEQDVALGGLGLSSHGNRIGGGVEEEFGDLLRGADRDARRRARGEDRDAYHLLAKRSKPVSALAKAQKHTSTASGQNLDAGGAAATHKFKKAMRQHKRQSRS